jgi:FkbM family methyltransferase
MFRALRKQPYNPATAQYSAELKNYRQELAKLQAELEVSRKGATSFSWEGEDLLAEKILRDRFGVTKGFYVDVGAYDPIRYSNTYLFYRRGWSGINIDARPGSMESFRRERPTDMNLEMGIAGEQCSLTYIEFEDSTLNGFLSEDQVRAHTKRGCKVIGRPVVPCAPLSLILDQYEVKQDFDLLSVDVEGRDLEVLLSTDFKRYRPKVVIAEVLGCQGIEDTISNPVTTAMRAQGYELLSRLDFSVIFVERARL